MTYGKKDNANQASATGGKKTLATMKTGGKAPITQRAAIKLRLRQQLKALKERGIKSRQERARIVLIDMTGEYPVEELMTDTDSNDEDDSDIEQPSECFDFTWIKDKDDDDDSDDSDPDSNQASPTVNQAAITA